MYECANNSYLSLAALEPKFWMKFCNAVERPEWLGWHLQPRKFDDLQSGLNELFAQKPAAEWSQLLSVHDCCVEEVLTPEKLHEHPQHKARGVFAEGPTLRLPAIEAIGTSAPPGAQNMKAGADTRAILHELGYSEAEIETLNEKKLVRFG